MGSSPRRHRGRAPRQAERGVDRRAVGRHGLGRRLRLGVHLSCQRHPEQLYAMVASILVGSVAACARCASAPRRARSFGDRGGSWPTGTGVGQGVSAVGVRKCPGCVAGRIVDGAEYLPVAVAPTLLARCNEPKVEPPIPHKAARNHRPAEYQPTPSQNVSGATHANELVGIHAPSRMRLRSTGELMTSSWSGSSTDATQCLSCAGQRTKTSSSAVTAMESSREPMQPSRLLKKKNTGISLFVVVSWCGGRRAARGPRDGRRVHPRPGTTPARFAGPEQTP